MTGEPALLISAGEASGDRMAAQVATELSHPSFGLGGDTMAEAGVDVLSRLPQRSAMGLEAWGALPALLRAQALLQREAKARRARVALLVGFSEFNAHLGKRLRNSGLNVLWYAPPQVWAWRSARRYRLRQSADAVALLFGFELRWWNDTGIETHFVGHPAWRHPWRGRSHARQELGVDSQSPLVALLPGSRKGEVDRLLLPMLRAFAELHSSRRDTRGVLYLSPALPENARRFAARKASGVTALQVRSSPGPELSGFDVALVASGTASLECVSAGLPPVIAFRTDRISFALGQRLVRLDHIGLPNIIAGSRLFPELLQDQASPSALASAARTVLSNRAEYQDRCQKVRSAEAMQTATKTSVSEILRGWLASGSRTASFRK